MKTKVRKILPFLTLINTLLKAMNFNMYKVILTFHNHKVIDRLTEKVEIHQELTLNVENELPKYLDYLKLYLEEKISKLGKKIHLLYFGQGDRHKSESSKLDTGDR